MSKHILLILASLLITKIHASVFVGMTGDFQKFRESKQGLQLNRVTTRVKIEATKLMYIRECQLSFGNGQMRVFHLDKNLKPAGTHSFYLKRDRLVKSMVCFGSTNMASKKLGKLKVYVLPKGKLTPVKVVVGGGLGAGAGPNIVNLPARNLNICVEKKKTILQLNTQAKYWNINGRGSYLSTWKYSGSKATLTTDYATANVVAYCKRRGSETFNIHWMLNFSDPRKYYMNIQVNCVPCGDPKAVSKVKKKIDRADKFLAEGKLKTAKRLLEEALEMIDKLHEREVLTPEEESVIEELEELILQYLAELNGEVAYDESEVESDDSEDDNFKKFLAIVGVIAGLANN